MKTGEKLLLKVYLNDPATYEIIYAGNVDLNAKPPTNGWKRIEDIR
jgi:hypothetical protein